jgi:hypothetical protein
MSDRVEERRHQETVDLKKQQAQKTEKEKEAAAIKFKAAFSQKTVTQAKTETNAKANQQQKSFNQSLFMSKQGIAGRSQAERLVKQRDEDTKSDKDTVSSREQDLKSDSERKEMDSVDAKEEAVQQNQAEQRFDAPIKDDDNNKGDQQQNQGQNQGQGQSSGQQQNQDRRKEEDEPMGVGGTAKAGGAGSATKTDDAQNAGKIAIGKTARAAASERIPQPVMQKMVDAVAVMAGQGMQEFQIQLKDDALGGGSLRVTLGQDKKLKIAFTMKDKSAKNLLESSKGVLMRMFEKKGMKLESLEVKVRGEA